MTAGARRLSAAGGGALCVFRVERAALRVELELRDARDRALAWPAPGRWRVGRLLHAGRLVDEVVVLGRASSLEIHGHGAPAVTAALAAALGADLHTGSASHDDDPAVANAARSLRGARALASAHDGPLAGLLEALRAGDLGGAHAAQLERAAALLDFGERLARPACVRLVGRPNAGKSTLFNRLTGGPRALVSERAGTTRDTVTHELLVAGVPLRLEDAAGVEPTGQPSGGAGRGADGAPAGATEPGADLLVHLLRESHEEPLPGGAACLRVLGRADLRAASAAQGAPGEPAVSGLTGLGCEALIERVAGILGLDRPAADDLWTPVRAVDRALVRAARGR